MDFVRRGARPVKPILPGRRYLGRTLTVEELLPELGSEVLEEIVPVL
jgi:hypothetical protein